MAAYLFLDGSSAYLFLDAPGILNEDAEDEAVVKARNAIHRNLQMDSRSLRRGGLSVLALLGNSTTDLRTLSRHTTDDSFANLDAKRCLLDADFLRATLANYKSTATVADLADGDLDLLLRFGYVEPMPADSAPEASVRVLTVLEKLGPQGYTRRRFLAVCPIC